MTLTYLMFWVLVGHFVGDYLLQTKTMALTKTQRLDTCLAHCLLYTLAVTITASIAISACGPLVHPVRATLCMLAMVFLSHFPIDRWSLADKYLKLIHGRQLDEVYKELPPVQLLKVAYGAARDLPPGTTNMADKAYVVDVATRQSFTALVYAVVDNTLHFLLMVGGFALLMRFGVFT